MSDYRLTRQAKHEYLISFQNFLEMETEFDNQVKSILVCELVDLLNADDHYPSSDTINLNTITLENDEKELAESIGAYIDYELFFDDDITIVFQSKLVYKPAFPDAAVDESNLRRFDVPFGQFSFAYLGDAYEEKDI